MRIEKEETIYDKKESATTFQFRENVQENIQKCNWKINETMEKPVHDFRWNIHGSSCGIS